MTTFVVSKNRRKLKRQNDLSFRLASLPLQEGAKFVKEQYIT